MASAPAQEAPANEPPRPILVDTIVATVNDSAILWSALATNANGRLRTLQARYGRLRPEDRQRVYREALDELIDHHTMAQAAKTFGIFTPEQVESFLARDFQRDEQQQIRDFGSHQAWSEALSSGGRTWQTFVSEKRVDKLASYAKEFAVDMRLQRQANLYLTPRMLRERYEKERDTRFVRPAEARVGIVWFRGTDAAAHAAEAAALWREQPLTSRALASRYPLTTPIDDANASTLKEVELTAWALRGPAGAVSEPLPAGDAIQVAKVLAYLPARNGRFEDQDVQDELRILCRNSVLAEFERQALDRARQRTEVWMAPIGP